VKKRRKVACAREKVAMEVTEIYSGVHSGFRLSICHILFFVLFNLGTIFSTPNHTRDRLYKNYTALYIEASPH
jgi:hypothetical protein